MTNVPKPRLLVIGALHIDEIATATAPIIVGESNPVSWSRSVGGVAANAARAAASHKEISVVLLANTGEEKQSSALSAALAGANVQVVPLQISGTGTGRYSAVLQNTGELLVGLADVEQAQAITLKDVQSSMALTTADAVVLDTNLSSHALSDISQAIRSTHSSCLIAALGVSPQKINRLKPAMQHLDILFLNKTEALSLAESDSENIDNDINNLLPLLCFNSCKHIVMTCGEGKIRVASNNQQTTIDVPPIKNPYSVNGPGDALAGATVSRLIHNELTHDNLVKAVKSYGIPAAGKVVTGEHKAPKLSNH